MQVSVQGGTKIWQFRAMEQEQLLETNFFTTEEWDLTPSGVKQFVVQQKQRIEELEKQLENLAEKVNINSQPTFRTL